MNLLLKILQIYIPTFIKKRKIVELFNCTALAFECGIPQLEGLSFDECLEKYALFTKEEVEKSIQQGNDLQTIKNRLYQNAFRLGEKLRKRFHVTTIEEVMTMSRILYRTMEIEFHGTVQGEITINRFFSAGIIPDKFVRLFLLWMKELLRVCREVDNLYFLKGLLKVKIAVKHVWFYRIFQYEKSDSSG